MAFHLNPSKRLLLLVHGTIPPLMPEDLKAATAAVENQTERKGKGKANVIEIKD